MAMPKRRLAVLVLLTSIACQSLAQATKEVVLPSGKKVRVIAVGQMNFSNDSPALMLKYETDLKISDLAALRKEVDEIWSVFRADVEQAKLTSAIISANEVPQGLILKTGKAYNFVFTKSGSGTWQLAGNASPSEKTEKK